MRRGEVWWAELPPPAGHRPVVILTRNAVLPSIDGIIVVLVTRTIRGLPTELILGRQQGLPSRCVANLDNLLTVPRARLTRRMGSCNNAKLEALNNALKLALEIPPEGPTSD